MGLILVRYMEHLVHIWPIYEWNSPHVSVWCDFGTVLVRVRGGATISKMSAFQNFPSFCWGGGGSSNIIFSQIQNSPNYAGGGGKKIMDVFHNLWHFFFGWLTYILAYLHICINAFMYANRKSCRLKKKISKNIGSGVLNKNWKKRNLGKRVL